MKIRSKPPSKRWKSGDGPARAPSPWRQSPFVVGRCYRVRREFDGFRAGETFRYQGDAHSIYDGATGYFFSHPDAQWNLGMRRWDVYDDEDLDVWQELFEEVNDETRET